VFHHNLLGEISQSFCAVEEPGIDVDVRRRRIPFLPRDGIVVENRPDRPAAIVSVVNSGERCVQKVIGVIFNVFGVE